MNSLYMRKAEDQGSFRQSGPALLGTGIAQGRRATGTMCEQMAQRPKEPLLSPGTLPDLAADRNIAELLAMRSDGLFGQHGRPSRSMGGRLCRGPAR